MAMDTTRLGSAPADLPSGPSGQSQRLDGPPPTPQLETPNQPPAGLQDLVPQPTVGADQLPPPLRAGLEELGQQVLTAIDAAAQLVPEFAADFGIARFAWERAMSRVSGQAGTQAVTPTAPGTGFPGGGLGSAPTM